MNQNKSSLRIRTLIRSALAAAALPVFFIYVMIAKPDYRLMNALGHVVVPVAHGIGSVITWPVRAVGNVADTVREMTNLRAENEELRARLDAALNGHQECQVIQLENDRLRREIGAIHNQTHSITVAQIDMDNRAFHHDTFLINRGTKSGIQDGMAVMSFDGFLIGRVIDVGPNFAKVRTLNDTNSRIAVRIAGSDVYGFLSGHGAGHPRLELLSDPEFQPRGGLTLVTSRIGGILPDGIRVGRTIDDTDVDIPRATRHASVMVIKYDKDNEYTK